MQLLVKTFPFDSPEIINTIDTLEQKRIAGRLGGITRNKKYGNPGTMMGRAKGGKKAIAILKQRSGHNFILAKPVVRPKQSAKLAELVGIIPGDGSIGDYQITVTLNNITEKEYTNYVSGLFKELFDLTPSYCVRQEMNTITIVVSSVMAIKHLGFYGLTKGNKIIRQVDIPDWIVKNDSYLKLCLRGLFDTDGCVYQDKHKYKDKIYLSMGIYFTSYSVKLLNSYFVALKKFNFRPTISSRSVRLRRINDVNNFFKIIGSSNPKHKLRYNDFSLR